MSIKLVCEINLPYSIKLAEEENYVFKFDMHEFDFFEIVFLFNNPDDSDLYIDVLPDKYCKNIKVTAILREYNASDYPIIHDHGLHRVELPEDIENEIFLKVNKKINEILKYIKIKTNMFWIENLPLNPISNGLGVGTTFMFYTANTKLRRTFKERRRFCDDFMIHANFDDVKRLDSSIFDEFDEDNLPNIYTYYNKFIYKAKLFLFEAQYEDFIINLAIACESFIRHYIYNIKPENDIVVKRLESTNFKYIDLYYNVLLKYLKGKSLKEIKEDLYNNLTIIYKLRNDIMHRGYINSDSLQKAGISKLDINEGEKIIQKVLEAFEEINKI